MEPFVQSFDAGAPLASGKRYLLSLATRTLLALGHGVRRMKPETRATLTELISFEVAWPLALLLAGWHLQARGDALSRAAQLLLAPSGAAGLWPNLATFRAPLARFTQAAADATDEAGLAAGGVYFDAAVESVSASLLSMVVRSAAFRQVIAALMTNLPPPPDLAGEFQRRTQAVGQEASASSLPASASLSVATQDRARRFEQADFGPRRPGASNGVPSDPRLPAASVSRGLSAHPRAESDAAAAVRASAPTRAGAAPEKEHTARTYLARLGWSASEIAAFVAGPRRDQGA